MSIRFLPVYHHFLVIFSKKSQFPINFSILWSKCPEPLIPSGGMQDTIVIWKQSALLIQAWALYIKWKINILTYLPSGRQVCIPKYDHFVVSWIRFEIIFNIPSASDATIYGDHEHFTSNSRDSHWLYFLENILCENEACFYDHFLHENPKKKFQKSRASSTSVIGVLTLMEFWWQKLGLWNLIWSV